MPRLHNVFAGESDLLLNFRPSNGSCPTIQYFGPPRSSAARPGRHHYCQRSSHGRDRGIVIHLFVCRECSHLLQEGAYADVTVKLGLIKLLQKRFDLCEEACVLITTRICMFDVNSPDTGATQSQRCNAP